MAKAAEQSNLLKPPLKWAGGKRWLVPQLKYYWRQHKHKRLVEPFCGGLSVALGLNPERALLNDLNPALINFYQHLKQGLEIDIEMVNNEQVYYKSRDTFNRLNGDPAARLMAAQLFYYLNRTGYNGLCRFNKKGGYNVPFGRYKTINYQDDFIYADPPYDTPFHQYSQQGFNWDDQVRLAEWLSQQKGPVVLSNQATERVKKLYKQLGFRLRYLDAPRLISCKGNQRQAVKEVLALRGF
jgi:DNA adenine methylase